MPHIVDLFETDFQHDAKAIGVTIDFANGEKIRVTLGVDVESYARYLVLLIPDIQLSKEGWVRVFELVPKCLQHYRAEVAVGGGYTSDDEVFASEAPFTGRIYLYLEHDEPASNIAWIKTAGKAHGYTVSVRQSEYVEKMTRHKQKVFVSYDSADRDLVARPLAQELARYVNVWFDEFALKPGDSIRKSLEEGLRRADKCVLLLTPNYLANHRWAEFEFDSSLGRQINEQKKIILPVWKDVTAVEIEKFSLYLRGIHAAMWTSDVRSVCWKLLHSILPEEQTKPPLPAVQP